MAKPLKKLEPKHHRAILLRIEGRSSEEIAKDLGCRPSTVSAWWSDKRIVEALEKQLDEIEEAFRERVVRIHTQGIDVLHEMLELPLGTVDGDKRFLTFSERLTILDRALERNPHLPRNSERLRQQEDGEGGNGELPQLPNLIQIFSQLPPDQLVAAAKEIASQTPEAIETSGSPSSDDQ